MSSIQGNLWHDVNSKGLEWPHPYCTAGVCSSHGLSLGLALLPPCTFPQMTHIPCFSSLLGSPLHFWFYIHSFTHCPHRGTLPGLSDPFLKPGWKPSWPHMLAFCMHLKPTPCGWCQGVLPAGAVAKLPSLLVVGVWCPDCWVLWTQSWGTNSLRCCHSGTWFFTFAILSLERE